MVYLDCQEGSIGGICCNFLIYSLQSGQIRDGHQT